MRPLKRALTFSLGVSLGYGLHAVIPRHGTPPLPSSSSAQPPPPDSEAILLGTSTVAHRRVSDAFVAEYDSSRRNPRWVAERLTRAQTLAPPKAERSGEAFREEPALPPLLRARLSAYSGSGYDRGHLAPAADHRHSRAALSDTFFLSNVSPQNPEHNREFWARLEKFARDLLKKWDTVYVVTGPLFLPSPSAKGGGAHRWRNPALGDPLQWVAVPTHFFKVVLARNEEGGGGGGAVVGAFVVPNAPIPGDAPLQGFAVPLAAVEAAGGVRLLRGGVGEGEEAAAERALGGALLENAARVLAGDARFLERLPPQLLAAAAPAPAPLFPPAAAAAAAAAARAAPAPSRLRHVCEANGCTLPPAAFWERKA